MRIQMLSSFAAILALVITTVTGHELSNNAVTRRQPTYDESHTRDNTTSGRLLTRGIDRNVYDKLVRKGEYLLDQLEKPAGYVQPSHWVQYADLEKYGWTSQSRKFDYQETARWFMAGSNEQIFEAYSLSKDPDDNVEVVCTNDRAVRVGDHEYGASQGEYTNLFNSKMIFATNNYSPGHNGPKQANPVSSNQITPLSHWSDVVFLQWQQFCKHDPEKMKKLVGIARDDVVNWDTEQVILEALRPLADSPDADIDRQPFNQGTWVDMKSDSGKAILGTASGAGVAFFLAQHKVQLGMMTVKRVKVYKPNDFTDKALLFELEPVGGQH
ncbi:Mitochondrial import inner membrane translocase subunit tim8 [Recurvomyces mirabilis]|nr:Mitochondrial import inner membrane translocase subunit tim8 [Recurvomyces mirabilis]